MKNQHRFFNRKNCTDFIYLYKMGVMEVITIVEKLKHIIKYCWF